MFFSQGTPEGNPAVPAFGEPEGATYLPVLARTLQFPELGYLPSGSWIQGYVPSGSQNWATYPSGSKFGFPLLLSGLDFWFGIPYRFSHPCKLSFLVPMLISDSISTSVYIHTYM